MANAMRSSTLETLGLGSPLQIFANGRLPVDASDLVDRVFGPASSRGALVISGANGIVGAGKVMQLGSRLEPFGIPLVGLDFPNAPDGVSPKYAGLVSTFGRDRAAALLGHSEKMMRTRRPESVGQLVDALREPDRHAEHGAVVQ